jgi:hypothetical protein
MSSNEKIINEFIKFHESCFIKPLKTIRAGFGNKGVDTNIYICGLLVCCGIDTLCGYYYGEKTGRKKFTNFIEKEIYKDKVDELTSLIDVNDVQKVVASDTFKEITRGRSSLKYISISSLLYSQFRCGLVHSFSFNGQAGFYINYDSPQKEKFKFDKKRGLIIDFTYFYDGYIKYWKIFIKKLKSEKSVKEAFINRYKTLKP